MKYKSGYKYQLNQAVTYNRLMGFNGEDRVDIETDYITLSRIGELLIVKGYCWDGPSGPTIDTKNFMSASLVHDALYQLMRLDYLDVREYRLPADDLLRAMCRHNGMSWLRAWYTYKAVRMFGNASASGKPKVVKEVP